MCIQCTLYTVHVLMLVGVCVELLCVQACQLCSHCVGWQSQHLERAGKTCNIVSNAIEVQFESIRKIVNIMNQFSVSGCCFDCFACIILRQRNMFVE